MKSLELLKTYSLIFVIALLLVACVQESEGETYSVKPDEVYISNFYFVTNALDFPTSRTIDICRKKKELQCNQVLKSVEETKDTLLSMPHEKALNIVLMHIRKYCKPEGMASRDDDAKCSGAVTAIYYFNTVEDNNKIAECLEALDRKVFPGMLSTRRYWYYNRVDINRWEQFADRKLDGVWKEIFLEHIHDKDPGEFGLRLLDKE